MQPPARGDANNLENINLTSGSNSGFGDASSGFGVAVVGFKFRFQFWVLVKSKFLEQKQLQTHLTN